jgi:hypothetical protein
METGRIDQLLDSFVPRRKRRDCVGIGSGARQAQPGRRNDVPKQQLVAPALART